MKPEFDFCLLIPCYNNVEGLRISLQSVRYDAGKYFVVVVDDGSKEVIADGSIREWLGQQAAFIILRNETNLGITKTLNKGLEWIKSNVRSAYIARLDCGDTCSDDRFVLQIGHLNEHPRVGLVGSWCLFADVTTGESYVYKAPANHHAISREMNFRNVFIHPTIVFRTSLLDKTGLYPTEFEHTEDYAFCWKLIRVSESFIFQQTLVKSEINKKGLSFANRRKQLKSRWKVVRKYGSSILLKLIGGLGLGLRFVIPKDLLLALKKLRG